MELHESIIVFVGQTSLPSQPPLTSPEVLSTKKVVSRLLLSYDFKLPSPVNLNTDFIVQWYSFSPPQDEYELKRANITVSISNRFISNLAFVIRLLSL